MKYMVKLVVVDEQLTPLLSCKTAEKMNLITVDSTDILDEFPDIFNGDIGTLPGSVRLTLNSDVEPILRPPKRLPIELKEPVKLELDRLDTAGVLTPVDEPTDWVNQMAIATKKNGSQRICIDPRSLNLALEREHYQLPVLDDILPDLAKAKIFSKVDLSHGYWHCTLEEDSSMLTIFSTPFGRYRWTRLPFGLSVSSEIFQKRLVQALEGIVGVACIADDILIYGIGDTLDEARQDHDKNLSLLLECCRQKSIKLNRDKVVLRVQQVGFMGHLLTEQGLKPDTDKVEAILKLETPGTKEEIERLNGTVNYLAKFLPRLSPKDLTSADPLLHHGDELSIYDGLVFKGERLVVPRGLRAEIKKDIHASHAGVEGCLKRARESVYWPCMNSELKHWISSCEPCRLFEVSYGKETLVSHDMPQRPWEKVAVDLFTLNQKDYLVTVNYYKQGFINFRSVF